ncbi:uncharacterized protein [Elaeis guineensis]|uniref:uncharacterized protein isoform X2 n=1 Tax=Elaeis guineensis var. tenera TaxID=51953 RepID=UPI003C6D59B1
MRVRGRRKAARDSKEKRETRSLTLILGPSLLIRRAGGVMAEAEEKGAPVEGKENVVERVAVLDFDMLCATVALQTQGFTVEKRRMGMAEEEEEEGEERGEFDGLQRMWEGHVLDCFEDRRIAIESACCPCYRFGRNMRRANLGSCFLQGSDNYLDDCVNHLICPCCTLCQESRTLEMNNVQDGVWHGRGDTICLGTGGEGNKALIALQKPPLMPTGSPGLCSMERKSDGGEHSWSTDDSHSEPLLPSAQLEQHC